MFNKLNDKLVYGVAWLTFVPEQDEDGNILIAGAILLLIFGFFLVLAAYEQRRTVGEVLGDWGIGK